MDYRIPGAFDDEIGSALQEGLGAAGDLLDRVSGLLQRYEDSIDALQRAQCWSFALEGNYDTTNPQVRELLRRISHLQRQNEAVGVMLMMERDRTARSIVAVARGKSQVDNVEFQLGLLSPQVQEQNPDPSKRPDEAVRNRDDMRATMERLQNDKEEVELIKTKAEVAQVQVEAEREAAKQATRAVETERARLEEARKAAEDEKEKMGKFFNDFVDKLQADKLEAEQKVDKLQELLGSETQERAKYEKLANGLSSQVEKMVKNSGTCLGFQPLEVYVDKLQTYSQLEARHAALKKQFDLYKVQTQREIQLLRETSRKATGSGPAKKMHLPGKQAMPQMKSEAEEAPLVVARDVLQRRVQEARAQAGGEIFSAGTLLDHVLFPNMAVVICIDASRSVGHLTDAIQAAYDGIVKGIHRRNPRTHLGVVLHNTAMKGGPTRCLSPTAEDALNPAIHRAVAVASEPLWGQGQKDYLSALLASKQMLDAFRASRQRDPDKYKRRPVYHSIVVIGDGDCGNGVMALDVSAVCEELKRAGMPLHVVNLGAPDSRWAAHLANWTGGRTYADDSYLNLESIEAMCGVSDATTRGGSEAREAAAEHPASQGGKRVSRLFPG